jgi:hypothetical protein
MVSDNDGCSWHTISASSSCRVHIKFAPTFEGTFSDALQIPSSDADHPVVTITLSGTATLYEGGYFLPDTGQNNCFDSYGNIVCCGFSGQDGSYAINPFSYTVNGVTVTDNNTGLCGRER